MGCRILLGFQFPVFCLTGWVGTASDHKQYPECPKLPVFALHEQFIFYINMLHSIEAYAITMWLFLL